MRPSVVDYKLSVVVRRCPDSGVTIAGQAVFQLGFPFDTMTCVGRTTRSCS